MMLLPSISRESRATLMCASKRVARWTNLAAALACIPSWLTTRTLHEVMRASFPPGENRTRPRSHCVRARASPGRPPGGPMNSCVPASLISIGRLTPVMTSTWSLSRNVMPRFDGVPPNMSVRSSTPASPRTRSIACAMSSLASIDIVVPANGDGGEVRQIADDHLRRVDQFGGELSMSDDHDADHGSILPVSIRCSADLQVRCCRAGLKAVHTGGYDFAISRCLTRTRTAATSARVRFRRSAIITERCRPPVQPMATVR